MDTEIKVCRICLNTDVKMYNIDMVLEYYISLLANDKSFKRFPKYLCYECASLVVKFVKFRKKMIAAQSILSNMFSGQRKAGCHATDNACIQYYNTVIEILSTCGLTFEKQIKEEDVKTINSLRSVLKSGLGYHKLHSVSMIKKYNKNVQLIVHEETTPADKQTTPVGNNKPDTENLIVEIKSDDESETDDAFETEALIDSDIDKNEFNYEDHKKSNDAGIKHGKVTSTEEGQLDDDTPLMLIVVAKDGTEDKATSQVEIEEKVQKRIREELMKAGISPRAVQQQPPEHDTMDDNNEATDNASLLKKYFEIINLSMEEQFAELKKREQSSNYQNAPYQCNLCYRGFVFTHSWKHHLSKHNPSSGEIECPICKIRFKKIRQLQRHTQSIHEKKYICKTCSHVSLSDPIARQHQKWHEGVTYKCRYCDEVYTKPSSYLSHLRIKHPSDIICDICGCSFVSKFGLTMHKKMMHKDITTPVGVDGNTEPGPYCKECDIQFVSVEAWNLHMVISDKHKHTIQFENLCRTCGKTFDSSNELRAHHQRQHMPKPLRAAPLRGTPLRGARHIKGWPSHCELCSEQYSTKREMWLHFRRKHPREPYPIRRDYVCDICGKLLSNKLLLEYHKSKHSNNKPFKCSKCGKGFYNPTSLATHEKQTHSDNRPFSCALCHKTFKSKGSMNRHHRSHTGEKPYICEICGKALTTDCGRKLHVRTVHMRLPAPPRTRRRKVAPPTLDKPDASADIDDITDTADITDAGDITDTGDITDITDADTESDTRDS